MEKKYVVPYEMLKAAFDALSVAERQGEPPAYATAIEAAIRWLLPQFPACSPAASDEFKLGFYAAFNEVEKMFLAPEPEIPEAVKERMWGQSLKHLSPTDEAHNRQIAEAYELGLRAGRQQ